MATLTVPVQPKSLNPVMTGKPAPRHDRKNLLIRMFIGQEDVIFHCQANENVGSHVPRHVRFLADSDCRLNFRDAKVFGMSFADLSAHEFRDLEVYDTPDTAETAYSVTVGAAAPMMQRLTDPKIFVP